MSRDDELEHEHEDERPLPAGWWILPSLMIAFVLILAALV